MSIPVVCPNISYHPIFKRIKLYVIRGWQKIRLPELEIIRSHLQEADKTKERLVHTTHTHTAHMNVSMSRQRWVRIELLPSHGDIRHQQKIGAGRSLVKNRKAFYTNESEPKKNCTSILFSALQAMSGNKHTLTHSHIANYSGWKILQMRQSLRTLNYMHTNIVQRWVKFIKMHQTHPSKKKL